jgi:hypothetical protein
MTCNVMPCRYDVIWIQWALLYLTDGENARSVLLSLCMSPVMTSCSAWMCKHTAALLVFL